MQNLDVFAIRAFGSDNSNILKYGAINGTFNDLNGNGAPGRGGRSAATASGVKGGAELGP
jgi:hypothetical protein